MFYFSKRLRALGYHSSEQYANVNKRFQETLASIPLIKAFVSESRESDRVISEVQKSQKLAMEQNVVGSVQFCSQPVPDIAKVVVLLVGAYLAIAANGLWVHYWLFNRTWLMSMARHCLASVTTVTRRSVH